MKIKLLTYGISILTLIFAFGLGSATQAHATPSPRATMYVDDNRPARTVDQAREYERWMQAHGYTEQD